MKKKQIVSDEVLERECCQNVTEKLKSDLQNDRTSTIEYIKKCFGELIQNEDFVSWLSKKLGYKPSRFQSLLKEKVPNKRKSLHVTIYQDIYEFWLSNSVNSNESKTNVANISKRAFLDQ